MPEQRATERGVRDDTYAALDVAGVERRLRLMAAPDAAGATRPDDEVLAIAKASIGAQYGLSDAQSRRLVGTTAAEIKADAKAMARELGIAVDDDDDRARDDRARDDRGRYATTGRSMNAIIRQASGRR